jgi:hypothetical protein
MAWTTVTVADLKDRKVAALVEACQTAALGSGQTDPTADLIASAIAKIRANVASCASNQVDADTTKIPGDLFDLACRMIIRSMKGRLEIELTGDERDDRREDERTLERIARCELAVETTSNPTTANAVQRSQGLSVVSKRSRTVTGTTLGSY